MVGVSPKHVTNLHYATLVLKDLFIGKYAATMYPIVQLLFKPLFLSKKITEDRIIEVLNDIWINIEGIPNFSGLYAFKS